MLFIWDFPFGCNLKPLQTWDFAYCNSGYALRVESVEIFRISLTSTPIFGFPPLQYKVFKLLGRASHSLCADFPSRTPSILRA